MPSEPMARPHRRAFVIAALLAVAVAVGFTVVLLVNSGDDEQPSTQVALCPPETRTTCDTRDADVDGDGKVDRIGAYITTCPEPTASTCSVWLRVITADNENLSYAAEGEWGHLAGVADIDGRPGGEIALLESSGAAAQWGTFLTYRAGKLEPVSYTDGKPFQLAIAGSIVIRTGIECPSEGGKHRLVVTHVHLDPPSADSTNFIGARETLEFDAEGHLVSVGEEELRFAKDVNGKDPPETQIGGLDCPGFEQFS